MVKKVLFSLFSIFLAYRSVELVRFIYHTNPAAFSGIFGLFLSLLLNLFITGVFAFPGFVFPTGKLLPHAYYRIKNPIRLNFVYQLLGVKYFKAFLLFAFWGKEKNRKKYFDGTKSGLENLDRQTRQSEFGHLGALVVILIVSFLLLSKGHSFIFGVTTVINIITNLYPVILQRKHRIQLERVARIRRNRNSA